MMARKNQHTETSSNITSGEETPQRIKDPRKCLKQVVPQSLPQPMKMIAVEVLFYKIMLLY